MFPRDGHQRRRPTLVQRVGAPGEIRRPASRHAHRRRRRRRGAVERAVSGFRLGARSRRSSLPRAPGRTSRASKLPLGVPRKRRRRRLAEDGRSGARRHRVRRVRRDRRPPRSAASARSCSRPPTPRARLERRHRLCAVAKETAPPSPSRRVASRRRRPRGGLVSHLSDRFGRANDKDARATPSPGLNARFQTSASTASSGSGFSASVPARRRRRWSPSRARPPSTTTQHARPLRPRARSARTAETTVSTPPSRSEAQAGGTSVGGGDDWARRSGAARGVRGTRRLSRKQTRSAL